MGTRHLQHFSIFLLHSKQVAMGPHEIIYSFLRPPSRRSTCIADNMCSVMSQNRLLAPIFPLRMLFVI